MADEEREYLDLEEENIIIGIPVDTFKLEIVATVITDDGEKTVKALLKRSDIRQARKDFLENVEAGDDYNAVYTLTDAGRAFLESQSSD